MWWINPNLHQQTFIDTSEFLDGHWTSPYPELDAYVTRLLSCGGTQGYIRQWSYFPMGELMVYDVAKNRWCDNIQRQHKSNNVMFVFHVDCFVYNSSSIYLVF